MGFALHAQVRRICAGIADHFGGEGGGVMGWVIRDLRMIWWGRGFGTPADQ